MAKNMSKCSELENLYTTGYDESDKNLGGGAVLIDVELLEHMIKPPLYYRD